MGGPVFNIVFNSLSYSIMYFCFKLRSKYLWSPAPHMRSLRPAGSRWAADELRALSEFRSDAFSLYSIWTPPWVPPGRVTCRAPGPPVVATGGVSHSDNSFRSAWPERANLSTCYSSQSVSRRLCLRYAESSKGIAFISFTSWFKPCCFL